MKIIELQSENFKKIKAVDITPREDEDVVIISGKNAAGKSSVLDAIWAAVSGVIPKEPIRKGQNKAEIKLNLGKYVVKRVFTQKGSYLTVESAEGGKFSSPQKMLDEFVGDLSFDPLEFIKMPEKEQRELLLKLVKFQIDTKGLGEEVKSLDELDGFRRKIYEERTVVNKEVLNKQEQLKAIGKVEKVEKISVSELFQRKQDLQKVVDEREAIARELEGVRASFERIENEICATESKLKSLREAKDKYIDKIGELSEKVDDFVDVAPEMSVIDKKIQEADSVNEQAGVYEKGVALEDEFKKIKAKSDELTDRLLLVDEIKKKAVAGAKMPINGLGITDGAVSFRDIPLSQASLSEQLKVSLAIAMALNPKLRVIRVCDGSLLDTENMKIIKQMAKENDYQIWIEVVDETGKVGFFIEEGEVKSD